MLRSNSKQWGIHVVSPEEDKKLSYRRGTARCVVSIEILPIATQQCRNYLYDKLCTVVDTVVKSMV